MAEEFVTTTPTPLNLRSQPMLAGMTMPPFVQQLIERAGGPRRVAIGAVGVATVAVILGIAHWATAPTWVPVYSNLELEAAGAITTRLDEIGIPNHLESGGTEVQVAATDLARARVALASGEMPQAGRPGLELFDQPAWGMTDFTQRINYRRALEGELERTIGKMQGVEAVKVHIAMEESTGFRRSSQPTEASVLLRLHNGVSGADMVQGITQLVSSSVDGVDPQRVTVLDDSGALLSSPYEEGSAGALASRELKMRSEVEEYLAMKAEQIVTQIVGAGNVRVQVSADINLDRVERTVESVDPEQQVITTEQRSEIIPGAQGGAGSTSLNATYQTGRSLETFSGAVGNVKRITAAVLLNDKLVTDSTGAETFEARTPEEIDRIQALVTSAMGIDAARGDQISVVSFPFDAGFEEEKPSIFALALEFQRLAIALVALLVTLIVAFRITRTLKTPESSKKELKGKDKGAKLNVVVGGAGATELESGEAEAILPPPGPSNRELVAAHIDAHPDVAVKMIRSWMKED